MPYNFEATFTQPLLAELDAGKIGSAQSWADAISRHYINTIKLGAPVGVPPILPAPGLNPTSPPPFAIGVVPFTTADSRKSAMHSVIYAYFRAKELKLQRESIQATLGSIKQLMRKIKSTKQRIEAINTQLKLFIAQLEQLPELGNQLDHGIKLFIDDQVTQLDKLVSSLNQGQLSIDISPDQADALFREELLIIQDLKQFSLTNKQGILRLSSFLAQQANHRQGVLSSRQAAKIYVQKRLTKLVKEVLMLVQIPVQPSLFVEYANNLERISTKYTNFARAIRQIVWIERFLRPKIAKLKKAAKELVNKLVNSLQPKVTLLRNTLIAKLKQYSGQVNNSKSVGLFKKAQKTIKQAKKENTKRITKQTARIKAAKKLIKRCTILSTKIVALLSTLQHEVESTEASLKKKATQVNQLQSTAAELEHANTQIELAKLHNYVEGNGFGSFYQIFAKLLVNSRATAKDIISILERQSTKYSLYSKEVVGLVGDIKAIQQDIGVLFGGKASNNKPKTGLETSRPKTSIKSLLVLVSGWLKPKLNKITTWLQSWIKQLANNIKAVLKKTQKALTDLAANLIPTSSAGRDPRTRLNMQRAKAKALRDKTRKIKQTTQKLTSLAKAIPAVGAIINNLASGKFKLGDNQTHINQLTASIYDLQRQNQGSASQHRLINEQQKLNSSLNSLLVAESILNALTLIKSSIGSQAKAELDSTFNQIKSASSNTSADYVAVVDAVREAINNPPKTLNQLKAVGEATTSPILVSVSSTSKLVELEKKILRTIRQPILLLLDNPRLKSKYQQAIADGSSDGLFLLAYRELQRIAVGISKQQSIILLCFRALASIIMRLFDWIKTGIKKLLDRLLNSVKAKLAKIQKSATEEIKHRASKATNLDGVLLSTALGLSARALWLGASWNGPTGSTHTTITIGGFRPKMRARVQDGATGFVREMARGFETQLRLMRGLVSPLPNTGIVPLQFTGYA